MAGKKRLGAFREGGERRSLGAFSSPKTAARELASLGTGRDTELIHVTREELSRIQRMLGTPGGTNPRTGLKAFDPDDSGSSSSSPGMGGGYYSSSFYSAPSSPFSSGSLGGTSGSAGNVYYSNLDGTYGDGSGSYTPGQLGWGNGTTAGGPAGYGAGNTEMGGSSARESQGTAMEAVYGKESSGFGGWLNDITRSLGERMGARQTVVPTDNGDFGVAQQLSPSRGFGTMLGLAVPGLGTLAALANADDWKTTKVSDADTALREKYESWAAQGRGGGGNHETYGAPRPDDPSTTPPLTAGADKPLTQAATDIEELLKKKSVPGAYQPYSGDLTKYGQAAGGHSWFGR